ncbi:MAG: NirA family protein [Verrucomicrobia bacterium]|nr:NirA family protein [Verrucomicrobiota bacterium]
METLVDPPIATEPSPGAFTPEQRHYLEGFFAGVRSRGLGFRDVALAPAWPPPPEPPPEKLIFEERIKKELHPLDAYALLLEHAEANKAPERENNFRFKWHGLFHLAPTADGFMARLRIPGGQLKSYQLREVAHVAKELAGGFADITTRANLQVRVIKPKDAPEVLRRIQSVGLHTRGAGADNVRNLTASPTAGIDPAELIDVTPMVQQLAQFILNHREFYNLPRKFNVAFDGGGAVSVLDDTNDLGFQAVQSDLASGSPPPHGVCFRVKLGGVTGHQTFAADAGLRVTPEDVLKVAVAVMRVFIRHGDRTDRRKARLKYLLERWGLEKFLAEVEKEFGHPLPRAPRAAEGPAAAQANASSATSRGHAHLGVHPQKQTGFSYVGVAVPVGRMLTRQMLRLAELAEHYGSGDLRLTVWQNLIIPNVPEAYVETLKRALLKMGFHWQATPLRGGLVACTGKAYCKYAATDTKGHALQLAAYLEKKLELDQPLNLHLTGCPNSCAQHYIGDIGLLGTKVKVAGETKEGYHVFVGGGFGDHQSVGRQVFTGISFDQLKPTLERMLTGYLRHRTARESFLAFTRRHDLNSLQVIFSNDE